MNCNDLISGGIGHSITFEYNKVEAKPKIKEITITQLDYGYVLKVGCKSIALDTPEKIIFALKQYLKSPKKVEDDFIEGKFKFEK